MFVSATYITLKINHKTFFWYFADITGLEIFEKENGICQKIFCFKTLKISYDSIFKLISELIKKKPGLFRK